VTRELGFLPRHIFPLARAAVGSVHRPRPLPLLFTRTLARYVDRHRLADGDFEVRAHEEDALGCCKAFGADPGQARLVERGTQFLRVRDKALQQESAICVVEPARYPRDRSSRQVWARCSDGGGCRAASLPCSEGALLTDVFENHCDSVAVLRFEYRTQVLNAVVDDELEADDCTCHGQRYVIDAANLGSVLKQQKFESSCTPSARARIIARVRARSLATCD
jgi:hypothetical protein